MPQGLSERRVESYQPFPRQAEFHASRAKYRLFGGAAGPGKTAALLWEAIFQALEFAGVDTLLLRRTFPELESSLLTQFRRDIPWRDLGARFNESRHIVTWPNGSTTRFGYCRNENDVYQYQGGEFLFIGVDELTHFTLKQWQFLTSRNRCPVAGTFPNMAGATNPGNIGHAWVKALWIDKKAPAGFDRPELYDPSEYDFIRARLEDNPIYANDAAYRRTLEALPSHLRRAFLEGDWDVFAGQYFDNFDVSHVGEWHGAELVAGEQKYRLEPWWHRWISIDWGFAHPSAVYWHTTAPDGRHLTYRELVQSNLTPRALGEKILERCVDSERRPERIQAIYLSPDAFADRTGESTIAEQLDAVLSRGDRLPRCAAASDDRVGGWQLLYELLERNAWVIGENCARLVECLPTLTRDDKHVEDIQKVEGDDPADSARYGLYSRLGKAGKPLEVRVAERVKDIPPSPTRHIAVMKAEEEERKKAPQFVRARRWRPVR